jgi:hypothetical protein
MQTASAQRLGVQVAYVRQGKAGNWIATFKRSPELDGFCRAGLVGFFTGSWEGQTVADEPYFVVEVAIDREECFEDERSLAFPEVWAIACRKALDLADPSFSSRHPTDVIQFQYVGLES